MPLGLQYGAKPQPIFNNGLLESRADLTLSAGSITNMGALRASEGELIVNSVSGDLRMSSEDLAQGATYTVSGNILLAKSMLKFDENVNLRAQDILLADTTIIGERNINISATNSILDRSLLANADRPKVNLFSNELDKSININVDEILLLRNNSQIGDESIAANLDITADFIIAVPKENSNINANPNPLLIKLFVSTILLNVNVTSIFGFEFSKQDTESSDINVGSCR